jgi:hypothetical protein
MKLKTVLLYNNSQGYQYFIHMLSILFISELFTGMKVDSKKREGREAMSQSGKDSQELSRAHQVRRILGEQKGEGRGGGGFRPRGIRGDQQQDRSRRSPQPDRDRQRQPRGDDAGEGFTYRPISLFGAQPLGIFTRSTQGKEKKPSAEERKQQPQLKTWDALAQKELKSAVTHPPANGFEEMILWTEQGKLWKYPVNNEQGT